MKISIITVCYNAADDLKDTLLSSIAQEYTHKEIIVVDGGSKDHTLSVIKEFQKHIAVYVSERDHGIYDAMNKGVGLAKGDYVIFMNSGDSFASPRVLNEIASQLGDARPDVIYGEHQLKFVDLNATLYSVVARKVCLKGGMPFCHQASLVKRVWLQKFPFVINELAADFGFFWTIHAEGASFQYIPVRIAKVSSGGASEKNKFQVISFYWRTIRQVEHNRFFIDLFYLKRLLFEPLLYRILSSLPKGLVKWLYKKKYKSNFVDENVPRTDTLPIKSVD